MEVESEKVPESVAVVSAARWSTKNSRVSTEGAIGQTDCAGDSTTAGGGGGAGIGCRGTGVTQALNTHSTQEAFHHECRARESPGL
jgi:nitrogenase subunit NifH